MASVIHPDTTMGAVELSVASLERSLSYYQRQIGLALIAHDGANAELGVDGRVLLRLREQPGARLVRRAAGLYHFALLLPSRLDLARIIRHFAETGTNIDGASDHLVSEALYLSDPDGHGIEIYRDRPRSAWYDERGRFQMDTLPLDLPGVMGELRAGAAPWDGLPSGAVMGHVHLQVSDLTATERFYVDVLGFERMAGFASAIFLGAGGYHHHLGANTWAGVGVPQAPAQAARLLCYTIHLPNDAARSGVLDRLRSAAIAIAEQPAGWGVQDPSGNSILFTAG